MTNNIKFSGIALITLFCLVTSCKKNYTAPATTPPSINAVIAGTWSITSFTQKTEDKTGNFSGMDFTFSPDSKLVVSGSQNMTGTWSYIAPTSNYYGSTASSFNLNIGTESPLKQLSRAWNISMQTNSVLKLDAQETAEDEHVTFTKN